jgi:hypothetical protein
MAPFFDTPGSTAGPYHTPSQQGIFSKVLQGVDVALKLGDFYQNWQTKSQAQKTGALQQFASKLGIQKALAGEDQPVDMSTLGPEAEGMGFKVPRITPESQVGMAGTLMKTAAGMPVTESRPGLTTPGDPGVAARDATFTKGMAAIPEVGGYAPLMPAQQTVAVVGKGGITSQFKVPKGAKVITDPGARVRGTEVYDSDGNVIGYSEGNVRQLRPSQDQIEARQRAVKQTPSGGGGKGGGGTARGKTSAQFQDEYFQQWRINRGGKGTKTEFDAETAEVIGRARAKGREIGKMDAWESLAGGSSGAKPPAANQKVPNPSSGQDYFNSFKNALSGPNRDAAIKRSQELGDGYVDRAKKEGLL